jgi:hypothetical protein
MGCLPISRVADDHPVFVEDVNVALGPPVSSAHRATFVETVLTIGGYHLVRIEQRDSTGGDQPVIQLERS